MLKAEWRIWLEKDGVAFFGDGRATLLEAIDAAGSLTEAAKKIGMAYRTAWEHLRSMEKGFGKALVTRQTGGKKGGGCTLTKDGKLLLEGYRKFRKGMEADRDKRFKRFMGRMK